MIEDLRFIGRVLAEQNQHLSALRDALLELVALRRGVEWAVAASVAATLAACITAGISLGVQAEHHAELVTLLRAEQLAHADAARELDAAKRRQALQAVALSAAIRAGAPEGLQGERARQRAVAAELVALEALPRTEARDREIGALRSELVREPVTQDLVP